MPLLAPILCAAFACVASVAASPIPAAYRRSGPSPDIPLSDPRLARSSLVEQVHLTGGDADAVFVTWVTNTSTKSVVHWETASGGSGTVTGPAGKVYSTLMDPRYPATEGGCQGSANYTQPECFYTSGEIHSVELKALKPATKYKYWIGDESARRSFTTPPAVGTSALRLAIVGDLGQTGNSSATVDLMSARVQAGDTDLILHAGDLSYADGDGYRWDSYARLGEKLWSAVPTAHVGGNHEISNGGENWVAYSARYPNQHLRAGSDSHLWYSFEAGPAHVVMLCSYADFSASSIQMKWLQSDLAKVDRSRTPWLLAVWHTPWYTSNHHHPMKEGAAMRASMEKLLHDSKVDVVFNGHVHAYERSKPVYDLATSDTGITYITIGDGGNREGFATPWNDPAPDWSALREDAYGYGELELSATEAKWTWNRINDAHSPNPAGVGDSVTIKK